MACTDFKIMGGERVSNAEAGLRYTTAAGYSFKRKQWDERILQCWRIRGETAPQKRKTAVFALRFCLAQITAFAVTGLSIRRNENQINDSPHSHG